MCRPWQGQSADIHHTMMDKPDRGVVGVAGPGAWGLGPRGRPRTGGAPLRITGKVAQGIPADQTGGPGCGAAGACEAKANEGVLVG